MPVVTSFADTDAGVRPPQGLLPDPWDSDFDDCWRAWSEHRSKNAVKRAYYEGKERLKNIGIAIPEELERVGVVVGWPKKAVTALANRSRFDGFTTDADDGLLDRVMRANRFGRKYRSVARSELVHGLAFVTATADPSVDGGVRLRVYSAANAACVWDYGLERIRCGITVHDVDRQGRPTRYELYEPDCVVHIARQEGSYDWGADVDGSPMGRPLMEPVVYDSDADYPLGHSRITPAVRDITDRAVREALRTEIASECSALPQKYILGGTKADQEEAKKTMTRWETYVGSVQWLTKDEDGDVPQYGQMPQVSMQPHIDYRAALASEFAAETSVPVEMLGVQAKTYTSSDSARANLEELVQAAEDMNYDNGDALAVVGRMALAISRGVPLDAVDDDVTPVFKNPERPSLVSQAAGMVQAVSVVPRIAETSVALEMLGFSDDQRKRMQSEWRRADAVASMRKGADAQASNVSQAAKAPQRPAQQEEPPQAQQGGAAQAPTGGEAA